MEKVSIFKVGLLAVAAVASGCGTLNNNGDPYTVSSNSTLSSLTNPSGGNSSLSSSSTNGFTCPALDVNNVVPNYNFSDNGTGNYQVCTMSSNASEILIKGVGGTESGDTICVFPAETTGENTDYQQTNWIPTSANLPLYQCVTASLQTGSAITFPSGITFNAAFIVDGGQANAMYECLQTDNPSECPQQYSYGEFR